MDESIWRDSIHLEQILELIDHIDRRVDELNFEQFEKDRDEIDLTAYRLAAIGEATRRLSSDLKSRHPKIPWDAIYGMRNIVAHDYGAIIPKRVWDVVQDHLDERAALRRAELADT